MAYTDHTEPNAVNPCPPPCPPRQYPCSASTVQNKYAEKYSDEYIINQLFTYHPANPSTGPKFEALREAAKYFAKVIVNNVPAGSDRTAAIRKLREAVMTANAGISLGGLSL